MDKRPRRQADDRGTPPFPALFPICLPHVRLYEVVSSHIGVLPYKYRKIMEMFLKLMKLC